jgi:phospholipase/carboxylesterase
MRARVILPYGFNVAGEGFSWWSGPRDDEARFAEDTRRAADRLAAMLDELVRRRPTVGKPIVTGFSQGGMLSFTIAVLHPEAVRAAFPVGGRLAEPLWPSAWPAGAPRPLIHAFHGAADDVVPIEGARGTVRRLAEVGLTADLVEYPGLGHHTSGEERRDLARAIEQAASL